MDAADTPDPDISRWIIEFLLRQQLESHILESLLRVLPLPKDCLMFKKSLLLRKIEAEVSNGVVSEGVLSLIEQLEELEPLRASDTMKAAYCAVAVDCTVRFLKNSKNDASGEYFEAVNRLWRKRIFRMEKFGNVGLISGELLEWNDELEAAVWDERICENMVKRSEGIKVVDRVMGYVKEENERLGPSFLDFVFDSLEANGDAAAWGAIGLGKNEESEKFRAEAQTLPSGGTNVDNSNPSGEVQDSIALRRRKHVVNRRTRGLIRGASRGAKISDVDEVGDGPSTSKFDVLDSPEVNKVQETLETSRMELHAVVKDPLPEALRLADAVIFGKASETRHDPIREDQDRVNPSLTKNTEFAKSKPVGEDQNRVKPSATRNAEIAQGKPVEDGQNRVNPSVIENAEIAQTKLVRDEQSRVNISVTKSAEFAQSKPVEEDQDRVNPSVTKNAEIAQDEQNRVNNLVTDNAEIAQSSHLTENGEVARSNGGDVGNNHESHQTNASKPSLMERNKTAHTFEWDDSQEKSAESQTRPHLPSVRRRPASPLNLYSPQKNTKRRKSKRWTTQEEDTLRTGVEKFGKGNWKLILHAYRSIFDERTEVDLKDKWRNMTRHP